jgi:hypothetical protein
MDFRIYRRRRMIEELLDKYHVDDFDDLLIEIIKHMKDRKEIIYAEEQD